MASYTQHYQLHQWEPNDNFLRTDFNGDLEKIDTALGGKAELVTGSYVGDGQPARDIDLGFHPKAVFVAFNDFFRQGYSGMAISQSPADTFISYQIVIVNDKGFQAVYRNGADKDTNHSDIVYTYCAFR